MRIVHPSWRLTGLLALVLTIGAAPDAGGAETALPGMTRVASPEIVVQTCRDQAYTMRTAGNLETLRREFSRRFAVPLAAGGLEAIIFKDKAAYLAYLDDRKITTYPDRGAYFPEQKAVLLYAEGSSEVVLQRNLIHEVVHHFDQVVYGDTPTWLDEGMAMYFQETDYSKTPLVLGVIDPRVAQDVKSALAQQRLLPVNELTGMSYASYHTRNEILERLHYDQSWALLHFFVHGAEQLKPADAASRARIAAYFPTFLQFLAQLRKTRTQPERAWQATVGRLPPETLDKDFQDYVRLLPDAAMEPNVEERWPNGRKKFEGEVKDGQFNGNVSYWYENGQMQCTGTMRNGQWNGQVSYWSEDGKPMPTRTYRDGKEVKESQDP